MFQPGEKVVYPQVGVGVVAEVTQKAIGSQMCECYRLAFPLKQIEIFIPVKRARQKGIRHPLAEAEIDRLLEGLQRGEVRMSVEKWKRWRQRMLEEFNASDPYEIASAYRYLLGCKTNSRGFSYTERRLLQRVRDALVAEIATVKDVDEQEAARLLEASAA